MIYTVPAYLVLYAADIFAGAEQGKVPGKAGEAGGKGGEGLPKGMEGAFEYHIVAAAKAAAGI